MMLCWCVVDTFLVLCQCFFVISCMCDSGEVIVMMIVRMVDVLMTHDITMTMC
jgi:hypothetical protein